MSTENKQLNWYALFVETGQEDKVKQRVEYSLGSSVKALVPKRKLKERKDGTWHEKIRVLFPGYVLLNGDIDLNNYHHMKQTPGLLRFLRTGYDLSQIEYNEISVLSRLIYNNEIIGFSSVLVENERVTVVDGPLSSMEGIIESINTRKGRAKVRLNFLGEERTVELGISVLRAD